MSVDNFYLPFSLGNTHSQDIRTRPSKYAKSPIRNWRFEQSEGIRPAEYLGVYRYLPVAFQDTNTKDWAVIPKGRIVSAITAFDSSPVSGLAHPSESGEITIGREGDYMGTGTGAKINVNIDSSYFGYDKNIVGLYVPANGGETYSGFYTTDDVTAGTLGTDGSTVSASGSIDIPANMPIGVAYTDIYQDIRGKYLNYEMDPDGYHFLTDWYIEVPFINYNEAGNASGCNPVATNGDYTDLVLWKDVNEWYTYLAFDSANDVVKPGAFVTSDLIGNYKLQGGTTYTDASGEATSITAYNTPKTPQTVGKLVALDTRMPKGGLEDVLTYPRSGMPGSQTAGMIKNLFDFAYDCLRIGPYGGSGSAPTIEEVYDAIRSGLFGLARIQLLVS